METISNALFWISNGLLVPVVVLLLLFFARAVLLAGGFFGEFYRRVHTQKSLAEQLEELTPDNIEEKANSLTGDRSTPLQRCVYKLYTHRDNAAYCERLLANFEVDAEQELGRSRTFVKLGPMLGLMGTLIPMGPALVGLATGVHCFNGLQYASSICHHCSRYGYSCYRSGHPANPATLVCP